MEKTQSLPTKIWNKTRMPTITAFIQNSIGSPATAIRQRKKKEGKKERKRKKERKKERRKKGKEKGI